MPKSPDGVPRKYKSAVIPCLILLTVVSLARLVCLANGICIRTIFGETYGTLRETGMIRLKEVIVLLTFAHVPAVVEVVAPNIRNLRQRACRIQRKDVGHGGKPRGIHPMAKVVQ